jgi:hypothetical protein
MEGKGSKQRGEKSTTEARRRGKKMLEEEEKQEKVGRKGDRRGGETIHECWEFMFGEQTQGSTFDRHERRVTQFVVNLQLNINF